ncbi:NADH dehydrogenase subunit E [Krasilnikovia cinnamomea]|uniref:NADH dehydrogenase subunit E n=1 Tax=Krasilnikovia cinnamomea TaxID=349313 RepID=A0A4Q7ZLL5_9ACTN|nr:NADH-quinone oxidoreductase subunit NuoE [Krasilnikovia cinnamomea]RZU51501.1 NADH dehydrogenase subunit E [Krasilnikovia cinnamomea]
MSDRTVEFSPAAAPLAEQLLARAREILARYPAGRERSALLPLLHLVQSQEGYVSPAGVAFCAEVLGINKAQVGAVATFYTMYKRRPTGEYLVSVCTNTLCNVMGGQEVYDELAEHLGVGHDETTADGRVTLEHAECLAACDYAPVVTVNYDFYDNVTPQGAIDLVDGLRAGERPAPTRGARLCSLKEMAIQLAGFADPRDGAVADGPAGAPTLRGVTLAQKNGIAVRNFDPDTPIPTTKPAPGQPTAPAKPAPAAKAAAAEKAAPAGKAAPADKAATGDKPAARRASTTRTRAKAPDPQASDPQATDAAAPDANAPASDAKPAGDNPEPQRSNLRKAAEGTNTAAEEAEQ